MPILPIMKCFDEADDTERATALELGLCSSVWSKAFDRATRIADQF